MYFIFPLALTLFIEIPIYFWLKPFSRNALFTFMAMNIILNPLMNVGLYFWGRLNNYNTLLFLFEVAVILLETLIIFIFIKPKLITAFLFSFLANFCSLFVGLALNEIKLIKDEKSAMLGAFILILSLGIILGCFFLFIAFNKENNSQDHNRKDKENKIEASDSKPEY